jgi:hypothetical protein
VNFDLAARPDGPAFISVPGVIERAEANRWVARGALAVGGIPPGLYVARATVKMNGAPAARRSRALSTMR